MTQPNEPTQLPTAAWKARPPAIVNKKGGRLMWDKQTQPEKHVCIFEMEHKGHVFTAEIVCMVCGVYLSAQQDRPPGTRQGRTGA